MSSFSKALALIHQEGHDWRNARHAGAPPRSWWVAIESFLSVACDAQPEQQFCKPISDLVDAYLMAMEKAANGVVEFEPDLSNHTSVAALETVLAPIGRAIGALKVAETNPPAEEPVIESIKQLIKEDVTHAQIAAIHGIKTHQVEQFLEGRFKFPEGHINPTVKDWKEERRKERAAWSSAAHRWKFDRGESLFGESRNEVEEDDWTAPPESVQDLIDQGVPNEQIARMWRMTQAEVEQIRSGQSLVPAGVSESEQDLEALTAPEPPKKGRK